MVNSLDPESGLIGAELGIDLPVYPVKGYTATVPLIDLSKAPIMDGVDNDRVIAYSRPLARAEDVVRNVDISQ